MGPGPDPSRTPRLDSPVLVSLNHPFVIEHPAALNDAVRALGQRLTEAATPDPKPTVR